MKIKVLKEAWGLRQLAWREIKMRGMGVLDDLKGFTNSRLFLKAKQTVLSSTFLLGDQFLNKLKNIFQKKSIEKYKLRLLTGRESEW